MFVASELPVPWQALEAAFIDHVDAARGVGTLSTVSIMPCRCWLLGLAGSWTLLLQNKKRSFKLDTNNDRKLRPD